MNKWLVVTLTIAILVASILIYLVYYRGRVTTSSDLENFLPQTLADRYRIIELVVGEDAIKMTKSIHWNPSRIAPIDAIIAVYDDGTRVWISKIDNACRVVETMASKMQEYEDRLPYTVPVQHSINERDIYLSLDKRSGQLHAFWCINEKVLIWVEVGSSGVDGLLEFLR